MVAVLKQIRRYSLPLVLFSLGLFFQLVVLPSSIPTSHYDVLGVRRFASIPEIEEAYQKLESRWSTSEDAPKIDVFLKCRYAFELLTNPTWKRDYDHFGIDEHLHLIEKLTERYNKKSVSEVTLPLLDVLPSDFESHSYNKLTETDFVSNIGKKVWLIQVYSSGSSPCAEFSNIWTRIVSFLDGVVNTAVVELSELRVASFLAERRYTGQTFFRNGLPSLVVLPPYCRKSDCYMRYEGDLTEDAIVDWIATTILGLPRIFYYSKESLDQNFIARSGRHKVKVVFFSATGQRAIPFFRKAAKDYQAYASFASVLWQDEDSPYWFKKFAVESAPAIVFLKDPGVKPVVYYGTWNSSSFINIMEENKYHDLPQLRSATSLDLGCDARGKSRAGYDTTAWYCVILAGMPSLQLNIMRETMRRVQNDLAEYSSQSAAIKDDYSVLRLAADAFNEKRLTLSWLDGELQSSYCSFYLHSETSYETCGPKKFADLDDIPRLFLVRYKRNLTENLKVNSKKKNVWDTFQEDDLNLASQLVAKYNGSNDILEIIKWISQTIEDGDTKDLPYFRTQTPELVPEDADSVFLNSIKGILPNGTGTRKMYHIISQIYDRITDPRLGPMLLLGACISFGTIYLQNQSNNQPMKAESGRARKRVPRKVSSPTSIADLEPKDAQQLLSSDSDSD